MTATAATADVDDELDEDPGATQGTGLDPMPIKKRERKKKSERRR